VQGEQVSVAPLTGTILVQSAGSGRAIVLKGAAALPVGSVIDASKGTMVLASAVDRRGTRQFAAFRGGKFQVQQGRGGDGMTDIVLRGGAHLSCSRSGPGAGRASVARATTHAKVLRRLWATDRHGRFRTHGVNSVATVRGTVWVTVDRCDGTLTQVDRGRVSVRDLRRRRSILVPAGHSYLARAGH
jgi:hypothetical protein